MIPYRNNRIVAVIISAFFLLILFYSYFEARNILFGPKIIVNTPDEGIVVSEKFVTITGKAENIKDIWMNGRAIPVTEDGMFEESILLTEGYNRVILEAVDKTGRETSEIVQIVYSPE
ncbi:hypothetical protein COU13_01705 [Candidatus Kaiserbacteria bacterium CG10_big_fil_rev_8_21_14_0_10_43_70]|uniref:IPT/TIG domain-containing protein n=1 Tax=Candidatus Kaiserbacteria bacterium CG10_big_fil_rev_8_21_14_0_10_43_70 TaxID=1974605 RepID=A0A2H0UIS2_9BACT|nr:MAG: hypothetical protein COU13_01705 [Candidatus Kaiserbacteria bacterium CG10_big_fil_rev_8_21_14_0_10_43_70]